MAKTTTMHLRWLRYRRQARLNGPRAAQRRTAPWLALPMFDASAATNTFFGINPGEAPR